jgi:hypothetical protein
VHSACQKLLLFCWHHCCQQSTVCRLRVPSSTNHAKKQNSSSIILASKIKLICNLIAARSLCNRVQSVWVQTLHPRASVDAHQHQATEKGDRALNVVVDHNSSERAPRTVTSVPCWSSRPIKLFLYASVRCCGTVHCNSSLRRPGECAHPYLGSSGSSCAGSILLDCA